MFITTNFHIKIVLILFITTIVLLALGLKEDFAVNYLYIPSKAPITPLSNIFNIDTLIKEQPQYLGWKNFWRKNFNKTSVKLENSITNSPYNDFSDNNKLLYDGIRDVSCL